MPFCYPGSAKPPGVFRQQLTSLIMKPKAWVGGLFLPLAGILPVTALGGANRQAEALSLRPRSQSSGPDGNKGPGEAAAPGSSSEKIKKKGKQKNTKLCHYWIRSNLSK